MLNIYELKMNQKSSNNEPFERLVSKVKQEVESLENRNGKKPTFEEYVDTLIDVGDISLTKLKEELRVLALAWSGAGFGVSNWKALFSELQDKSNSFNKESIKKEVKMNDNKFLNFISGLGLELDEEIVKGIRSIGVFKLLLGVGGFLLLRFLISYFGSEESVFTFYFYSSIGLILFLSWYVSQLKENTKMFSLFKYILLIVATVISIVFILILLYGILEYIYQLLF